MPDGETEYQMVLRHIMTGERLVRRQRELVDHLRSNGLATERAVDMLARLEKAQQLHVDHLGRLAADGER